MNRVRLMVLVVVAAVVGMVAFGLWSRPSVEGREHGGFSAERVVEDIEVISREHHSVAHPVERAAVREYLVKKAFSVTYGARNLRREIQRSLEDPISEKIIDSFEHPISRISITVEQDEIQVEAN